MAARWLTFHHHQQINNQQQHNEPQSQQQTFISSSAYYGYVPVTSNNKMSPTNLNNNNINYGCNNGVMEMDVEEDGNRQKRLFDNVKDEHRVMRVRKRCLVQDDDAGFNLNFKKFRQEAVVTNVFSMVQENNGCQMQQQPQIVSQSQNTMDWPRCTMSRYYA